MRSVRDVLLTLMLAAGMASSLTAQQAGYPSRDANLDVLPGFRNPPPGYGEVPFYWWVGEPLTKERIAWQLDQLKGKHITSLQINYAHTDKGGQKWGLTIESEPRLFSEPWWDLFGWFLKEAGRQGMSVSVSDYTLGWPGQGWYFDEILKESPEARGAVLAHAVRDCPGAAPCSWDLPAQTLSLMAFGKDGSAIDLRPHTAGSLLRWTAPPGEWRIVAVYLVDKPASLDPMNPLSGSQTIARFFQPFEDRHPGESGRGLNFFFSDELDFGLRGWLWNRRFAEEFRKRKGYDVIPELPALFLDVGPRTPKVRLDYSDVMVSLSEAGYFRPLYEWHRSRGMMYGCDHGGRGLNITEFGDYFRTQRWVTAPGCDQPGLTSHVIKNKVASSIAHLYERPRTWLEGFYSSGWGTSSADLADATWRNFAMGHNLLTLHGLYYSTQGGWWEWAPPCNHFRMPYWAHMGEFLRASERLSYLLSQGHHRADVAILYPVAAVEAGLAGKQSVEAAFTLGTHLYGKGIDFDFMDFESLDRAAIEQRQLQIAGEAYRVLVLPSMRAARHSTLRKALAFHRAGGIVLALGELPEASDRSGRDDSEVRAIVRELFGTATGRQVHTAAAVEAIINSSFPRDVVCGSGQAYVLHRKAGPRDIFMVYGAQKDSVCSFRASGQVELWNPWSGQTTPLPVLAQTALTTRLRMPLDKSEPQLIVFSPGTAVIAADHQAETPERIAVEGPWEFELKSTLDNRWGDYRLPAANTLIGAEARRLHYAEETSPDPNWQDPGLDDSNWRRVTSTYGPRFWKLGPLPESADTAALNATPPAAVAGKTWEPLEFSMRWGIEDDAGHQGYHGLKGEMPEHFIALGRPRAKSTTTEYEAEAGGSRYYLWTSATAPRAMDARIVAGGLRPAMIWVNGAPLAPDATVVRLNAGGNPVLLRYDGPGLGHFLIEDASAPRDWKQTYPLASRWYNKPGVLPLDTRPRVLHPAGWYRFTSPPGMRSMTIVARGTVRGWVDGKPLTVSAGNARPDGAIEYRAAAERPSPQSAKMAIRVEQERGYYGGAALPEPIAFDCGKGVIVPGDWSQIDGLASYSGGAWFRKAVSLTAEQARRVVVLDLGSVAASAEVHVNGQLAGIRVAPPWKVDVSRFVRSGANRVEVLVYNTLANQYQTIPTRYRGSPVSGLLGPVSLITVPRL